MTRLSRESLYRRMLRLFRASCAVCGRRHRTFTTAARCWATKEAP